MIFILADDQSFIDQVRASLEPEGYELQIFKDSKKILEMPPEGEVELVIFSILPENCGFKFKDIYQKHFPGRDTSFIFISSLSVEEAIEKGLNYGVDDYILKPFSEKVLQARVNKILKNKFASSYFQGDIANIPFPRFLQFCEEQALSGEMKISSNNHKVDLKLLAGEIVQIITEKPDNILSELNQLTEGTVSIKSNTVDFNKLGEKRNSLEVVTQERRQASPSGILSGVQAGNKLFQIQTEFVNSPSKQIVTIVILDGKVVLKEKSDSLSSMEFREVAKLIEKQHLSVEDEVREKVNSLKKKKGRPFSILIVDSSPMILSMTRRKLSDAGLLMTTVGNAEDAIELVHTRNYNLVISGVELKGMDGLNFCKYIKGSVFRDMPFILFPSKINEEILEKGTNAGIDDAWEKSISPEGLAAKVKSIVQKHEITKKCAYSLEGNLKDTNPVELIEMLRKESKTGILSIIGNNIEGHIHLSDGNIIEAATPLSRGEEAFFSIITIGSEGTYHFIPTESENNVLIREDYLRLLMKGAKFLIEIEQIWEKKLVPIEKTTHNVGKNETKLLPFLDGNHTFHDIIEEAKIEPYQGFELITNLVKSSVIKSPFWFSPDDS